MLPGIRLSSAKDCTCRVVQLVFTRCSTGKTFEACWSWSPQAWIGVKFTAIALLIASVSAVTLTQRGTPQNQSDYWARQNADAAAAAADAAKAAAAVAAAAAAKTAAATAAADVVAIREQSGKVWGKISNTHPANMHPDTLKNVPQDTNNIKERDFARAANDISDNTHTGEHWDGPKRGRIIREYRRALDQCNISGQGKCTLDALGKNYPTAAAAAAF